MDRIMIRDTQGGILGWFDADRADSYREATDWNGTNHISRATSTEWEHQKLYRTRGGQWVLCEYSDRQGTFTQYSYLDREAAKTWLVANDHDDVAANHFGLVEEERGPGRPTIGGEVSLCLGADLLTTVTAEARRQNKTRAATIRDILTAALTQPQG